MILYSLLILLSVVGLTLVFFQLGLSRGQKEMFNLKRDIVRRLEEVKWVLRDLDKRVERENRSLGHKVNNVNQGLTVIANLSGTPWSPEPPPVQSDSSGEIVLETPE